MRGNVSFLIAVLLVASLFPASPTQVSAARSGRHLDAEGRLPVVYVHGYNSNGCEWDVKGSLRFELERQGHAPANHLDSSVEEDDKDQPNAFSLVQRENAAIVNYGPPDCKKTNSASDPAEQDFQNDEIMQAFEQAVEAALQNNPAQTVDVVAHSMGGLVARRYLNLPPERAKYQENIRTVVMIGTPNHGSFSSLALRTYWALKDEAKQRLDSTRVEWWKQAYLAYSDEFPKLTEAAKRTGFFGWLASGGHQGELDKLFELEDQELEPSTIKIGAKVDDEAYETDEQHLKGRFTKQFEEYLSFVRGKAEAVSEIRTNQLRLAGAVLNGPSAPFFLPTGPVRVPSQLEQEDTPTYLADGTRMLGATLAAEGVFFPVMINGLVYFVDIDALSTNLESPAIDRLLPDYVPVAVGSQGNAKPIIKQIPTNHVLLDLNKKDLARSHNARYVLIAGVVTKLWTPNTVSEWGSNSSGAYSIDGHDDVVEWHSVMLPTWGTDQHFVVTGGTEARHTEMTSKNAEVRSIVLDELDGPNFFNPKKTLRLDLQEGLHDGFEVKSGSTLMLDISGAEKQPNKAQLLLEVTAKHGRVESTWVFKETEAGDVSWELMTPADTATRYWTGDVSNLRRLGVVTPHPLGRKLGGDLTIMVRAESRAEDLEVDLASLRNPYEMRITRIDADLYGIKAHVSIRNRYTGPVTDLESEDLRFYISDTGRPVLDALIQPVFKSKKGKRVSLVLDYSGSMQGAPHQLSMEAARLFLEYLDPNLDWAGAVSFTDDVKVLSPLTQDLQQVRKSIEGNPGGNTNLYGGIMKGIQMPFDLHNHREVPGRADGRRLVVVFTDGINNRGNVTANQVIAEAQRLGTTIYFIALGAEIQSEELERIATATGGRVLYTVDPDQIATLYASLNEEVAAEYTIYYWLRNSSQERSLDLLLNKNGEAVAAAKGLFTLSSEER